MRQLLTGMFHPDQFTDGASNSSSSGEQLREGVMGNMADPRNESAFPQPDPGMLAFGSSSASPVSAPANAAADRLRRRLNLTHGGTLSAAHHARELDRIRRELLHTCGLGDPIGPDVIFSTSSTKLYHTATRLTCCTTASLTRLIVVGAEESGMPAWGDGMVETVNVPLRNADGTPRQAASVDGDVGSLVNEAIAMEWRVLIILADVSPTGLSGPGIACAVAVRDRFPDSVTVLVDACQFRLAPSTLRAYLEHGFMVAMSASTFLASPAWAGALILPDAMRFRLRRRLLHPALMQYSTRADWPPDWPGADMLDEAASLGQLMRWEAALEELRAFRRVPDAEIARFLHDFAAAIQARLQADPHFEPLALPPLERITGSGAAWDCVPTMFPFLLHEPSRTSCRRPIGREDTERIHHLLQSNLVDDHGLEFANGNHEIAMLRCQLGEPVPCGSRNGVPVSALRLCVSARMVIDAARGNSQAIIDKALATLDKTALLVRVILYGSVF
ncbi:hypothetical protein [Noviherbaspirillum denitrificans]|uniref:Selenocysteine lyase n=1 Tax=Noviherbaspirillum denitrificans TaxID=1968433 RepID=A0A254TA22_9BURK|nr:hypothetical protein [Noviherbaspirillum denitrificans]OWW19499.1 hypothetical protein AYR66_08220 [Noviherbaspirillum denitrificans]